LVNGILLSSQQLAFGKDFLEAAAILLQQIQEPISGMQTTTAPEM